MLGRDQRTHLGGLVGRIAELNRLGGGDKALHHLVVDRFLHQESASSATVLAGVVEDRPKRRRNAGIEVGVGKDQIGGLAAEFERDPFDPLGGLRS